MSPGACSWDIVSIVYLGSLLFLDFLGRSWSLHPLIFLVVSPFCYWSIYNLRIADYLMGTVSWLVVKKIFTNQEKQMSLNGKDFRESVINYNKRVALLKERIGRELPTVRDESAVTNFLL